MSGIHDKSISVLTLRRSSDLSDPSIASFEWGDKHDSDNMVCFHDLFCLY